MAQTWEATVQHTKQQDACAADSDAAGSTDSGRRRPRWAERKADGGPGKYAFLPWLLMGMGAFSNVIEGKTGNPWLAGLGLLAFNSVYITVVWTSFNPRLRHSRQPLYALALLTAITFAIALGFGGDWFLFFPLLSLASGTVRALRGKKLAVWLISLSGAAGYLTGWHNGGPGAFGVGYGTFLSGTVTATVLSLFDTIQELNTTRQELARSAVEKERLRFSRDLHDLLGHTLSVVVVKAEAVRRLAPRNLDAALAQAADIEAVGRQALTEIREAVTGYREGSLSTELDRARSVLEAAGIEPVVRQAGPPLPPQAGALLGWVVREGVTNTVRHSGATTCEISVHAGEDRVRLTITDDGRGPDGAGAAAISVPGRLRGHVPGRGPGDAGADAAGGPDPADGTGAPPPPGRTGPVGGTGLKGLTERLAAAGGTLHSGPDGRRGFRVTAELPVGTGDMAGAEGAR
ncbi:two-component system, NarL family, sensor histidine kinase DesK [Streptomyces sp. 2323.1]|uniref:sensor histidine kinase n=1 Tax=Streptomyces sp. 2323.1 TaxID=1938841 RepID=UPI000BB7A479|nr:histidine kinase [Streptomyces sp. 2323.1]SOE14057.1 two-component system, NarL family, sensor histidine kinase DesK [Streptomyces sp. 2323.1]